MSKRKISRIQSPDRKISYRAIFVPVPTEEEKRQKAHELRDKERRFWEALKTELAPEHIPKNGG